MEPGVRRIGCGAWLLGLAVSVAVMWPLGLWARLAYWVLVHGWGLLDI